MVHTLGKYQCVENWTLLKSTYVCRYSVSGASGAHSGACLQSIPQGGEVGGAEVHRATAAHLRNKV